jgi:predicted flap endonuclease-1-like 5' DNA nuclease
MTSFRGPVQRKDRKVTKLTEIEGVGEVYASKLQAAGIATVEALLEAGAAPKGRQALEETTGIGHKLILEWVNLADLMRVKGVGEEYADLLEEAGVDTVKELRNRNPENLYKALVATNEEKKLVRHLPGLEQVKKWVEEAKALPPKVTY